MSHRLRTHVTAVLMTMPLLWAASLVAACGGNEPQGAMRSYELEVTVDDASDLYRFIASGVDVRVGDQVTFVLNNTGTLPHDLEVLSPEGSRLGATTVADPQQSSKVTVLFDEAGDYRLNCNVDNHLITHQMYNILEVTEPDEPADV